ncbi:MAG: hypothetical protein CMP32_01765 [Rickettsiales bacterium]|nr:hypothetical protein [Rickettsiales bacterium]
MLFLSLFFFVLFSISNRYLIKISLFPFPYLIEVPLYLLVIVILFLGLFVGYIVSYIGNLFK